MTPSGWEVPGDKTLEDTFTESSHSLWGSGSGPDTKPFSPCDSRGVSEGTPAPPGVLCSSPPHPTRTKAAPGPAPQAGWSGALFLFICSGFTQSSAVCRGGSRGQRKGTPDGRSALLQGPELSSSPSQWYQSLARQGRLPEGLVHPSLLGSVDTNSPKSIWLGSGRTLSLSKGTVCPEAVTW